MIRRRFTTRTAPVVVTLLVVTSGMAFSLLWLPLTQAGFYHQFWLTPDDLWSSYRTAHWVGWGAYGSLYGATGEYLTFPGLAVLLAPLAVLTHSLGLTEGFPLMIPHPTAWLFLGPVEMLLGCSSLFGVDALAERLGVTRRRRWIVCAMQGFLLWPLLVLWGHPEDAIAFALAVFGLVGVLDRRWARAGWLFGAAISFQPLVLLLLPVCIGRAGTRRAPSFVARSLGPSGCLLALPFLSDWRGTWNAVVEQPQQIAYAHLTPWTSLAPRIAQGVVSCGPTRVVAVLGSCLLGFYTARRRSDDRTLVYCAALCIALRFASEATLEGYYIWPALALLVLVAAAGSRSRLALAGPLAMGLTVATARHFGPWWLWWGVAVAGLALGALIVRPGGDLARSVSDHDSVVTEMDELDVSEPDTTEPDTTERDTTEIDEPESLPVKGRIAPGPIPRILEPAP